MTDNSKTFETKTVRAVRGLEGRTISKWEREGWELVSQTPGKLQTELLFRRPKPKSRALLYGIVGGSAAVVLAIVIGIGVATEGDSQERTSASETTTSTSAPSPSSDEEAETTETGDEVAEETVESAPAVLTTGSSTDLQNVLELTDYCDSSIAEFATEFEGRTIIFDASIDAMNPHDGASTRYDILLSAGDFSETEAPGPAFQFRDVNTTYDLHFAGDVPDTIGVGTNVRVTAEIDEYESSSCRLLLEPIETIVR